MLKNMKRRVVYNGRTENKLDRILDGFVLKRWLSKIIIKCLLINIIDVIRMKKSDGELFEQISSWVRELRNVKYVDKIVIHIIFVQFVCLIDRYVLCAKKNH